MYAGYPNSNAVPMPIGYRPPATTVGPSQYPSNNFTRGYPAQPATNRMPTASRYPYNPNALNPAVSSSGNDGKNGVTIPNNANELLNQKGTKYKVSKIYRIQKTKPYISKDDSSDDETQYIPMQPISQVPIPQTAVLPPPPQPPPLIPKASSPSSNSGCSTCSHCSTCTYCSCTDCRIKQKGIYYDDCPACRVGKERQKTVHKNRK